MQVHGTRFTDKYLAARHALNRNSYASYTSGFSPKTPTSPKLAPPASPPRKVVTDFATFGAPKTASVFGTAVASTPFSLAGGTAAFGGMQRGAGRSAFDEEDEEEDDGRQKIEVREGSISLDQVLSLICPFCGYGLSYLLGQTNCHAERVERVTGLISHFSLGRLSNFTQSTLHNDSSWKSGSNYHICICFVDIYLIQTHFVDFTSKELCPVCYLKYYLPSSFVRH
jgi:hypothetical protein